MPDTNIWNTWTITPLSDYRATLGESPVWDAAEQCIWWVDIDGKTLCRTDAATGKTRTWDAPERIGFIAPSRTGLIVGLERGLFHFDAPTGYFILFYGLSERGLRFNDATFEQSGTIWAGTMDIDNVRPVGTLYRITPDLDVSPVMTGFTTINGLAVDEDLGRLYLSDSHPSVQKIWAMPNTPEINQRRLFCDMTAMHGRPDGGTVAPDGTYWIAGVDGGYLHGFRPDGTHVHQLVTPMYDPTKLIFSCEDTTTGWLTSKTDGDTGKGGWLCKVKLNDN